MSTESLLKSLFNIKLFEKPRETILYTDEPKFPGFITYPNKKAKTRYYCKNIYGQGFHPIEQIALIKSIGEYLERLSVYNPDKEKFFLPKIPPNNINLEIFDCYSNEQSETKNEFYKNIKKGKFKMWPVADYKNQTDSYLPAQLIFLSPTAFSDELPIRKEQITTGAALGKKGENDAFRRGFLEVVERDACMVSYLKKKSLKEIKNFSDDIQKILDYLNRYNFEIHIYDISSDFGIPTTMTLVLDRTGVGPSVNIGSKADLNYRNAIFGSIMESIQCRRNTRFMMDIADNFKFPKESEIDSMEKRYFYWYRPERIDDLSFWLKCSEFVPFQDIENKNLTIENAVDVIKDRDYNIFVANITLPEIDEGGFEVLKVLIPELHPLYLDEKSKCLFSKHAGEIPDDSTLKPHPFS